MGINNFNSVLGLVSRKSYPRQAVPTGWFFGIDLGPPDNWTTPLSVLEAVAMTDPVHIARDAPNPELIFKHQASFADGRDFGLPPNETYDRGIVAVQIADDTGVPAGP